MFLFQAHAIGSVLRSCRTSRPRRGAPISRPWNCACEDFSGASTGQSSSHRR